MRVTPKEFERIPLRVHSLLSDVPLHDVWATDLRGGSHGRTVLEILDLLSLEKLRTASSAVNLLVTIRAGLGHVFGWDRESSRASKETFLHRLSSDDYVSSLVPPGTPEGPFRILFVSPRESISEIQNTTVHAFSVFALLERSSGYRLYWAIYVRPDSISWWYMRLIDPFRRLIIYPTVLRYIKAAWARAEGDSLIRS